MRIINTQDNTFTARISVINGNSDQWSNTYTVVNSNSASWSGGGSGNIGTIQTYLSTNNVLLNGATVTGNVSASGNLTVIGDISSNDSLLARNNLITGGPLSKISGKYSTAEGFSVVIGNNAHAEGFYCGVIGTGGHAEGSRSFVGLRYTYLAYTAATRTLTFSPAVTANMDLYASFTPGTSAIFYSPVPVRFEPVVIESRDSSTGSIVLTKDVAGINISSSTRFLVLPGNGGLYGHAEGYETRVSGDYSHAEGRGSWADGSGSHAEGFSTAALGSYSHAEGTATVALGDSSHAEGQSTTARGTVSHAAGNYAEAAYDRSWIWHGSTNTQQVSTTRTDQFLVSAAGGIFFPGNVGIGTDNNSNALTVNGNISANGTITVLNGNSTQWNSNYTTTNSNSGNWSSAYTTLNSISSIIPNPATTISTQIGVGTTALNSINFLNTSSAQLLYTVPAGKTFLVADFFVIIDTVVGGNVSDTSLPTFRLYRSNTLTNATNQVTSPLGLTSPDNLITTNRYYRSGGSITSSNGKALVSGDDASPQNRIWFRVDNAGTNTYTGLSGRVIVTGNLI